VSRYFADSSLFVYANDRRDPVKQARAQEVLHVLLLTGRGTISVQVMQEYANTVLTKLGQRPDVVIRQLRLMESLEVVVPSPATIRRCVEIRASCGIGFWDAAIVAAAESGDCDIILSEDLNDGQFYAGIQVLNPFSEHFDPGCLSEE
jgi:predicted nucleic acid-binding protein